MHIDLVDSSRLEDPSVGLVYIGEFLSHQSADQYLSFCLENLPWREEIVTLFGKRHIAPRLSCAIGDPGCSYRYQGSQTDPVEFPVPLNRLRNRIANTLQTPFNFVLATLYRSGSDYVGWHADDERDLVDGQTIANVSLGSTRRFHVKTQDGLNKRAIDLEHGSLTLLSGQLQRQTKHRLAPTKRHRTPRVVLSFRQVLGC